ncbi:MAG TPA: S9 family peptidase, partial [Firmicutes bacterium]|nr:S9 family peptidase [Candidatus Fermentithermobacillaceae bacterium]
VALGISNEIITLPPAEAQVTHWQYRVVPRKHTFNRCCRLTSVNEEVLSELQLSQPEYFLFTASDGVELEGWLMKPINFEPGKKYPVVVEIHGGPAVTYGLAFFHEFQVLASNGYGVFYCNPRGSLGYGEWFAQQVIADQGGMDYQDIMALRNYMDTVEWADSGKVGVTGGSYGGFMTNWIVGHTDRFHAAVTQRSISNWYTKYGTSDIGFYGNRKGMGMRDLWDSEGFLMERSPIRYAPNVNTPILIIHAEQDYRCPMEQAEQWYIALKRLGKTVEFARFAGENHELSRSGKPWNRRERLRHILRWFGEHLK